MIAPTLSSVDPAREVAVIINVNTKDLSTKALRSTIRCCRVPVVVIDCESTDGSIDHFKSLQQQHDFTLISMKLRPHGATLDLVFRDLRAERILLVDSDVEVSTGEMIGKMRQMIEEENVYGSGYFHPEEWLTRHYGTDQPLAPGIGCYMGRPWIPFTLLRRAPVLSAIEKGGSFMHRVSKGILPWRCFQLAPFRKYRLASYRFYDTGASIHEQLSGQGFRFSGVDAGLVPWSVKHLHGKTREVLRSYS
jgi:hypothetical protein